MAEVLLNNLSSVEVLDTDETRRQATEYRGVLTDRERFIFESLFNLGLRTNFRRQLSLDELAVDFGVSLPRMSDVYHRIITKLIVADALDSALEDME